MKRFIITLLSALCLSSVHAQVKTLNEYLESALKASPLLNDYRNQSAMNAIDSARILAGYRPQVQAVSDNYYAPVIRGYGYESAITNTGNFGELISVSKQVLSKSHLQNQLTGLRLATDSLEIARKISEQDIRKAITTQYIKAYGSWQQYRYARDIAALLEKEDTLLKRLTQAAVYRQTDYLSFLVTLKQQQFNMAQFRMQYQNDFASLNYLCGLEDTSFAALAEPALAPYGMPATDSSVFYRKFYVDSLVLKNQDAAIDFSYKPRLSVFGDAGFLSTLQYQPYKNFGFSLGVNLVVPLYDGHQKKMLHSKIALAEQSRKGYRDFFGVQHSQILAQLTQQLNRVEQLIAEGSGQIRYVEALMEANARLLATGDARITDYIIAINNLLNARSALTQSQVEKWQIINELNYWSR